MTIDIICPLYNASEYIINLYNSLLKLYNSNSTVKQNINYDENGNMIGGVVYEYWKQDNE